MDTQDLATAFAAVRRQALEEAARVALQEVAVGNELSDSEQGASAAAERTAERLQAMARQAQGTEVDIALPLGTTVYVVCLKGRGGKPRGVEKVAANAFHMEQGQAAIALAAMRLPGFAVYEASLSIGSQPVTEAADRA